MSIIDDTYFRNDIKLPQKGNDIQIDSVTLAIDIYEPEILTSLLGYELYNILNTAWLAFDQETPIPLPDRIDKLINGDEFSIETPKRTVNLKWNGLINAEKKSLTSYYVHYKYLNDNETRTSTTGRVKSKKENSHIMPLWPKVVYSQNKMVELYGVTPRTRTFNLRGLSIEDYFLDLDNYEHYNLLPSAYNYIVENISTYPEWIFKPITKFNILDI